MKKSFYLFGIFISLHSFALPTPKADTVYYLIDTAKVPVKDRLWVIQENDQYRNYVIQCPCLKFNGKPTFFNEVRDKGKIITKAQLKRLKLISLSALIRRSKSLLDTDPTGPASVSFFFIEPKGKNYIIREETPTNPEVHITMGPDVFVSPPDNSAFEKPGLITVVAKDVGKYLNQSVITTGRVENTKVDFDNTTLLYVGGNYPNQDFIIFIKPEDRRNFDLPDFKVGKRIVRVTGKVTEYKGQPAIGISKENQLIKNPKQ